MYPAPQPGSDLVLWLVYIKELILFLGLVAAAFLAYTKFVIERGIFPPAQFDIQCNTLGLQHNRVVLEVLIILKNIGSSVLIVNNLSVNLRYLINNDEPTFRDIKEPTDWYLLGRLNFPHCLKEEAYYLSAVDPGVCSICSSCSDDKDFPDHDLCILGHRTFVKPGVEQRYTYITSVPESASYVKILASFEYPKDHSLLKNFSMDLSRRLGLINYNLKKIKRRHTCERAFKVEIKNDLKSEI